MKDLELPLPLQALDPEQLEPGYWGRFQREALRRGSAELARRRAMASVTMSQVVLSWSRMVIPGSLAAATMAALLFTQASTPAPMAGPLVMDGPAIVELQVDPLPGIWMSEPGDDFIFVEMEQW